VTPSTVPASLCHANCLRCGLPEQFHYFGSGPGGSFGTYLGARTGNLYRLDLERIHVLGLSRDSALAEASAREGGKEHILAIPEQLVCRFCKAGLAGCNVMPDREEVVHAFLV
jgi:hypothetical protein